MSTLRKPWESFPRSDLNNYNQKYIPDPNAPRLTQSSTSLNPPPLPTRPNQYSNIPSFTHHNYSPYNYGSYNSLGSGYSNFSGNYGYQGYQGYSQNFGSNFAQQADMSSRHAFQSIESVVRAFGSVAMLLDSTFQAVFNSFRAVIGVADHFSRMKLQFSQILSSLALLRTFRWIWLKIRALIGTDSSDMIWKASSQHLSNEVLNASANQKNWPLLLFFVIVFGGPWLLWKLLSSITQTATWANGLTEHYVAIADFDFEGELDQELSFKKGAQIILAPKELQPNHRGWLLASVDGKKVGLIPQNYIHVVNKQTGNNLNLGGPSAIPDLINQNNIGSDFDDVYNEYKQVKSSSNLEADKNEVPFIQVNEVKNADQA